MEKGLAAPQTLPIRVESITSKIKKEMFLFEIGATGGNYLQKSYYYILSIGPTSVVSQRLISAAGFLCSKTQTPFNEGMIDAMSFLKRYFQN